MPKKRKSRKSGSGPPARARHLTPETLLGHYERWLGPGNPVAGEYRYLVSVYLDLKARYLDPDPTRWTEGDVATVLTELLPAKVLLDDDDRASAADAMASYLDFLTQTGRAAAGSPGPGEQRQLLGRLRRELPAVLADPSRRSMSTNLLTYAMSQGVDLTDPEALNRFMSDFNELDQAERTALTDTGALGGGGAFGLGGPNLRLVGDAESPFGDEDLENDDYPFDDDEDPFDDLTIADMWPAFLGPAPRGEYPEPDLTLEQLAAFLSGTTLARRAEAFLRWLGPGRPVTRTGALRRADTVAVVEELGLPALASPPRSMWEVRDLAYLWDLLLSCDLIQVDGSSVHPSAEQPWPGPDAWTEERVERELLLHGMAFLLLLDSPDGEQEGWAAVGPLTTATLAKAAEPDGFTLPDRTGDPDADVLLGALGSDYAELEQLGLVERRGAAFHLPPALVPALTFATGVMSEAWADLDDLDDNAPDDR